MDITFSSVPPAVRFCPARHEVVFRACTEPQRLERWFARPTDRHTTRVLRPDPCPGGSYRIGATNPQGRAYLLVRTSREVIPPERLIFHLAVRNRPPNSVRRW